MRTNIIRINIDLLEKLRARIELLLPNLLHNAPACLLKYPLGVQFPDLLTIVTLDLLEINFLYTLDMSVAVA